MSAAVGRVSSGNRQSFTRSNASPPEQTPFVGTLSQLTDCALWLTVGSVIACFGGRTPIGQFVFTCLATTTALIWMVRQAVAGSATWRSTRSMWFWTLGIVLALVQIIPLTTSMLEWISPEHARVLSLWGSESLGLLPAWTTLSFNPAETTSGLVTFLCYGLVFLVAVQRIDSLEDAERMLKGVTIVGVSVALFGLLQFFFSNGMFFWFYQHPRVNTADTVLGPFTNRNHLAQFLAMTIGPALWWLSQAAKVSTEKNTGFGGASRASRMPAVTAVSVGLGLILIAGLLSLSRAGIGAMIVALVVSLALLSRRNHLPGLVVPAVLAVGMVVGGAFAATNYQVLAERIDRYAADGRTVIWAANLRLATRFPALGTGIGTHLAAHQLETDRVDDNQVFSHAESGYLQVLSESGFVGLGLALLCIFVILGWSLRAYRAETEPRITAAGSAILASLAANLLHAGVDFFWYTPGCMLIIVLLTASACRLAQLSRAAQGMPEPIAPRSGGVWASAGFGLTALAAWMIAVKLPAATAEPHRVAFQILQNDKPDDDNRAELEQQKMARLVTTAKADPQDAYAQLQAASGYLRLFGLKQSESENSISLDQLRDAALASEFESPEALLQWVDAAVGPNKKYLKAAQNYARKAIRVCPLEGQAYIILAKLDFLRDPEARLEEPLRQQALKVRPYDATIDFEIGKAAAWRADQETASKYWRKAFQRSDAYRREISAALARTQSAEELIAWFEPDWLGLGVLHWAFREAGRDEEVAIVREKYALACMEQGRQQTGAASEFAWREAVRLLREADEPERAIEAAREALEQHSQCLELHKTLGELLIDQHDFAGAAKHLQWAALRAPEDEGLQQLAASVVKEKVRYQTTADRDSPAQQRLRR